MKLCDTTVLVDIDRGGIDEKVRRLDEDGRQALSAVTVTELRLGVEFQYDPDTDAYRSAIDGIDRLLDRFDIVPVTRSVSAAAARLIGDLQRNGTPVNDLHDSYIAATARTEALTVLTANVDHFARMPGIEVVDWNEY